VDTETDPLQRLVTGGSPTRYSLDVFYSGSSAESTVENIGRVVFDGAVGLVERDAHLDGHDGCGETRIEPDQPSYSDVPDSGSLFESAARAGRQVVAVARDADGDSGRRRLRLAWRHGCVGGTWQGRRGARRRVVGERCSVSVCLQTRCNMEGRSVGRAGGAGRSPWGAVLPDGLRVAQSRISGERPHWVVRSWVSE